MSAPASINEYFPVAATSVIELRTHIDAWRNLAENALEDNAYLHPDFILSAFEYSQFEYQPIVVFVYSISDSGRELAAAAVFELCPRSWSMPVPHLRASAGRHGYVVRPMLCRNRPEEALASLCEWLALRSGGWHAILFRHLNESSPVGQIVLRRLERSGCVAQRYPRFRRAVIRAADDYFAFLGGLPARRRQDLRRLRRRMEEQGKVELRCLERYDADPGFSSRFVTLESKSWKSVTGSAILSDPHGPGFFDTLARRFGERSAIFSCELLVNGRPFAMSQNLLAGDTMFALKIAFDPEYRRLSPGIVLAIEFVEHLIRRGIRHADGGNASDSWLNRLWPSSIQFDDLMWSLSPAAKIVGAITPAARKLRSRFQKGPPPTGKAKG